MSSAEAYVEADSEGGGQESPLVRLEATLSLPHTSRSHMLGNLREHEVPSWGAIAHDTHLQKRIIMAHRFDTTLWTRIVLSPQDCTHAVRILVVMLNDML